MAQSMKKPRSEHPSGNINEVKPKGNAAFTTRGPRGPDDALLVKQAYRLHADSTLGYGTNCWDYYNITS